ncbi:hypothetical protein Lal_00003770 [Lupinus albus]|nr:hypothetical protein Lal_00003770 [Lupinus albus]
MSGRVENPYYDRLVAAMASDINALIRVGEKIENRIKSGKISDDQAGVTGAKKPGFIKKKEEETHFVSSDARKQPNNNFQYQSRTNNYQKQQSGTPNNTYGATTQTEDITTRNNI